MNRSDIKGVLCLVTCPECHSFGSVAGSVEDCERCKARGAVTMAVSIDEFELMLDRDLLAEPGGTG